MTKSTQNKQLIKKTVHVGIRAMHTLLDSSSVTATSNGFVTVCNAHSTISGLYDDQQIQIQIQMGICRARLTNYINYINFT